MSGAMSGRHAILISVAAADAQPSETTVDALLDTVRDFMATEDRRSESLNGRGVALVGITGIIVSLSGTLAKGAAPSGVHGTARTTLVVLLVAGLMALTACVGMAVWGVLLPTEGSVVSLAEVERYPLPEFVAAEKVLVQGRTMRGLIEALSSKRRGNNRKATRLALAYGLLASGIAFLATQAIISAAETL
jgi:hypothetical protein